jgi:hypothetical protein
VKEKVIFTPILNDTRDNRGPWPCVKGCVFIMALFSLMINLSCENSDDLRPRTNSPPVITSVRILRETPYAQSELNGVVQCQDPDYDPVTFRYQWMRNGKDVAGENKNVLTANNFKKGDLIQVKVTPSDGKADGNSFLSDPVKVLNSSPVIQDVRIEPRAACANDDLKTLVKGSDADGDSVNYTYQWEKNGVILNEEKKDILEKGQFKKGDSIAVVVTPDDGESTGIPRKSEPMIISNSPPVIVSSPNKTVGDIYTYQVKANDPDDDPIVFTLRTSPAGMEINKETGFIRWEIRKGVQGTQSIAIEASDSEGAKCIQKYTLSLNAK